MSNIRHDEREDAYQHGYRAGVHDERERAVKAGVMREGKYIEPTPDRGAVEERDDLRVAVNAAIRYLDDPTCENRVQLARLALDSPGGQ